MKYFLDYIHLILAIKASLLCTENIKLYFSLSIASGALYVRKYFNEAARQNAMEMVADIRSEFEEILKNVDWMDEETKNNALLKAKAMKTHIAYPDELMNDRKLEEFYEGVRKFWNRAYAFFKILLYNRNVVVENNQ